VPQHRNPFTQLWDWLTVPSASLKDIGEQRSARLAASFLLIILLLDLVGGIARVPRLGWAAAFAGGLGLSLFSTLFAYPLTRTKWYRGAIFIFSVSFAATAYYSIITEGSRADHGTIILIYVPISLIVASSFLSAWAVLLLTGLNVGAYLVTPLLGATVPENINGQLGAITLIGIVLIALANFRTNLERARLKDLQKINQDLKSMSAQLEQQVAEMERFTYTVSHDLKSPLVTIKGFLGMLKKDMAENRQDRVQHDFERITSASEKMGTLLSELLELSRIGRVINPPEEVDLIKVTEDALEMLDGLVRSRNITVQISPDLPIVNGDHIRLHEVMENLIDNAAKYMGDQKTPLIEIGKRESGIETIIYVKDNGIGIEPQFHTKIFGLFEKLDSASEGTGIGLALIKRIIEVHGGRIWVESEGLGKGSTFCFTIPDGNMQPTRSTSWI
jgi:signal transduction histidine kinase